MIDDDYPFFSEAAAFIATWGYFWTDLKKRQNGLNRISHPQRSLSKENRRSYIWMKEKGVGHGRNETI